MWSSIRSRAMNKHTPMPTSRTPISILGLTFDSPRNVIHILISENGENITFPGHGCPVDVLKVADYKEGNRVGVSGAYLGIRSSSALPWSLDAWWVFRSWGRPEGRTPARYTGTLYRCLGFCRMLVCRLRSIIQMVMIRPSSYVAHILHKWDFRVLWCRFHACCRWVRISIGMPTLSRPCSSVWWGSIVLYFSGTRSALVLTEIYRYCLQNNLLLNKNHYIKT